MNLNYIGHNQWDGKNFPNFYNQVISNNYDKIILFCQNEWEWHMHDPVYFPLLIEHCKNKGQKIDVITGSSGYNYIPIDKTISDNCDVFYWDTYWLGKTYAALIQTGQSKSIDPKIEVDYKYHFICMNNMPKRHRLLIVDLLSKHNLINKNAISLHENNAKFNWQHFKFKPFILEPEFVTDKQQHRLPTQYYESFCQLVTETSDDITMISEKTAIPLIVGKPFLVASSVNFHQFLKSKGFELYDEIFDYSFDSFKNEFLRYAKLVENFVRLDNYSLFELKALHKKIIPKIEHNKNRAREIIYDLNLYPKLALEVIDYYHAKNKEIDSRLIQTHLSLEHYKNVEF